MLAPPPPPAPLPQGMEQDHLIELSLRHADKSKIAQIKAAALSKAKQKVRGRAGGDERAAGTAAPCPGRVQLMRPLNAGAGSRLRWDHGAEQTRPQPRCNPAAAAHRGRPPRRPPPMQVHHHAKHHGGHLKQAQKA